VVKRRSRAGGKTTKAQRAKAALPKRGSGRLRARRPAATGRETKVARLTRELKEAQEQQAATSEVLRSIAGSRGELEPVFNIILASANRLCQANYGTMYLRESNGFRAAARQGHLPETVDRLWWRGDVFQPPPGVPMSRAIAIRRPVLVTDLADEPSYREGDAWMIAGIDQAGIRSMCTVPMLKDDEVVGLVSFYRREIRPFNEKQIALVQNFANQAVIAIENARLLGELRQRTIDLTESLEQQTATSDVLKVISSSPGELQPVFSAMLENAVRICGASFGTMLLFEGDQLRRVAVHNAPPAYAQYHAQNPVVPATVSPVISRIRNTKRTVHTVDLLTEHRDEPLAKFAGARSVVTVPMLKDDEPIGIVGIFRQEVRPFTDKQVELLQNFAAQAVIAIENTRLLNELRQSL
jgi:GAF domain-containing protein